MNKTKKRAKGTIARLLKHVIVYAYLIIVLFPLIWLLITALKKEIESVQAWPPIFIPPNPTLNNFIEVLIDRPFGLYMLNSIIVASTVTFIALSVGSLAAYGYSRGFKWSNSSFLGLLVSRMMPPVALVVPYLYIMTKLRLIDTFPAIITAHTFVVLPFAVWLLKPYYDAIPDELFDSARVDGCSKPRIFWNIMLPLTMPGLVTTGIISFVFSWINLLWALVLTRYHVKLITKGIYDFFGEQFLEWNLIAAAAILSILPAVIFVFIFQKRIVKGLVKGAIKG